MSGSGGSIFTKVPNLQLKSISLDLSQIIREIDYEKHCFGLPKVSTLAAQIKGLSFDIGALKPVGPLYQTVGRLTHGRTLARRQFVLVVQ